MFHVNVNFPSKRSTSAKYELLRMCSRKFSADKAINILTEQPFLILHPRVQYLKELRVVVMESFSSELKEAMVHKSSEKRCFQNIGGTYKKTPTLKYKFR